MKRNRSPPQGSTAMPLRTRGSGSGATAASASALSGGGNGNEEEEDKQHGRKDHKRSAPIGYHRRRGGMVSVSWLVAVTTLVVFSGFAPRIHRLRTLPGVPERHGGATATISGTELQLQQQQQQEPPQPRQKQHQNHPPQEHRQQEPPPGPGATSERYRPTKTTHWLPGNPPGAGRSEGQPSEIERMVLDHCGPDKDWYRGCAYDNNTAWVKRVREASGGTGGGRFFSRACNGTGLHPYGVHSDPFRTHKHNCSVTSFLRIERERDHFWEEWTLRTYDSSGTPKAIGGDVFYVVYSEEAGPGEGRHSGSFVPRAVGVPTDLYNGTYRLDFVQVPFSGDRRTRGSGSTPAGRLTVHPLTTCFIGELYPPLKDGWKTGGATNLTWTLEGIDRPSSIGDWPRPSGAGPSGLLLESLSGFDRVVFFGDSILQHMVWDVGRKAYHGVLAEKIESGRVWVPGETTEPVNVNLPLSPKTLEEYLSLLEASVGEGLRLPLPNNDNDNDKNHDNDNDNDNDNETSGGGGQGVALVLGSAAWDVIWPAEWQGPTFRRHLSAVRSLVERLLGGTIGGGISNHSNHYNNLTVVWKLPYAIHLQAANPGLCFSGPEEAPDRGSCSGALRYATTERFRKVYRAQKKLLEQMAGEAIGRESRLRALDLYEISYLSGASWMIPNDSIHYSPEWNTRILELLYR